MWYWNPLSMNEALPGMHNLDGCTLIENDDHPFKLGIVPADKYWNNDEDNYPALMDIPAPTHADYVESATFEIQRKINEANDFLNRNQWPSLLALGRLSEEEKVKFNQWLDYLEALKKIDPNSAPAVVWPVMPAVRAS